MTALTIVGLIALGWLLGVISTVVAMFKIGARMQAAKASTKSPPAAAPAGPSAELVDAVAEKVRAQVVEEVRRAAA